MNDFNLLARVYDPLARVMFRKQLQNLAMVHLGDIRSSDRVLILGGGTGGCLERLPAGCQVDFVDSSAAMVSLARERRTMAQVIFHQADFVRWAATSTYQWILAPFFLDSFSPDTLDSILKKIGSMSDRNTWLVVTDFRRTGRFRHDLLLWAMHRFFRFTADLEAKNMHDLQLAVMRFGWYPQEVRTSRNQFIFSVKYRLQNADHEN